MSFGILILQKRSTWLLGEKEGWKDEGDSEDSYKGGRGNESSYT